MSQIRSSLAASANFERFAAPIIKLPERKHGDQKESDSPEKEKSETKNPPAPVAALNFPTTSSDIYAITRIRLNAPSAFIFQLLEKVSGNQKRIVRWRGVQTYQAVLKFQKSAGFFRKGSIVDMDFT